MILFWSRRGDSFYPCSVWSVQNFVPFISWRVVGHTLEGSGSTVEIAVNIDDEAIHPHSLSFIVFVIIQYPWRRAQPLEALSQSPIYSGAFICFKQEWRVWWRSWKTSRTAWSAIPARVEKGMPGTSVDAVPHGSGCPWIILNRCCLEGSRVKNLNISSRLTVICNSCFHWTLTTMLDQRTRPVLACLSPEEQEHKIMQWQDACAKGWALPCSWWAWWSCWHVETGRWKVWTPSELFPVCCDSKWFQNI